MAKPEGMSPTLSPYAPNFWNHIDAGITPLVRAFTSKNYLPYSSCEGHSIFGRRFISLAFPDKESARKLSDQIRRLNQTLITFKIKTPLDYYHEGERDLEREIGWLNSIYLRGYQGYYFLEISIGENSPPKWGNFGLIFSKWASRDCQTNVLVDFVNNYLPINEN
jgi:hypothetical protein